jgi:hypothetical protein
MAGSFGFERGKYELSMRIAELGLLPAVRAASDSDFVVADGFSCRTQILQGTGRKALHLAELLHVALKQAQGTGHKVKPNAERADADGDSPFKDLRGTAPSSRGRGHTKPGTATWQKALGKP